MIIYGVYSFFLFAHMSSGDISSKLCLTYVILIHANDPYNTQYFTPPCISDDNIVVQETMQNKQRLRQLCSLLQGCKGYASESDSVELDRRKVEQRLKQISYGKSTIGYANYLMLVPKHLREEDHPATPRSTRKCSKRSWYVCYRCCCCRECQHDLDNILPCIP